MRTLTESSYARQREGIKKAIRHAMVDSKMKNLKSLAETTGIPYATLMRQYGNPMKMPLQNICKIALALDTTPDELVKGGRTK